VTIGIAQVIPNSNDAGRRKKVCCPTSLRSRHQRKASGEAKRSPGSLRNKIARAREAAPLGHQSAKRTAENSPPFYRWAPRILNPAREADDGIKPGVKRSEPRDHYANQSEEPAKRPIARDVRKRDHQSTVGRFAGFDYLRTRFLGFRYAPLQALCFRPLRGLAECFRPAFSSASTVGTQLAKSFRSAFTMRFPTALDQNSAALRSSMVVLPQSLPDQSAGF
jgi:hypothetical protein